MMTNNSPENLLNIAEVLCHRAIKQPDRVAFTFLKDGEQEKALITYKQLDEKARIIGAMLKELDIFNNLVLLLYPPGLDYIAAFFGCLYAGVIAVPCYPMRKNRKDDRLLSIIKDSQAKIVLTTTQSLPNEEWLIENYPGIRWIATDTDSFRTDIKLDKINVENNATAFLQYTSGSTSEPKGVMVSHMNLMYNLNLIRDSFELTSESKKVIWLPPYHDMGLIGGILEAIYAGYPVFLMSPASFIEKPINWLKAISKYKATVSGGPNFAYELCIRRITPEQKEQLDLSSWITAFNGAEPIRHNTIQAFYDAFKQCGFRKESFYPCYGLAEATLLVSGPEMKAAPQIKWFNKFSLEKMCVAEASINDTDAKAFVGCGHAMPGQSISIVDPDTMVECMPNQVGEIWVKGPSVTKGYWNKVEDTEKNFQAYIQDSQKGSYLRTGDLGFLNEGQLFITGRIKDLIIIRGINHYPNDIETVAEKSHTALRASCGAAFSVDIAGEERLVIVYELERMQRKANIEEVARNVRQAIFEKHGLQLYDLTLIKPGSIPKTSSGKLQRNACRIKYIEGSLDVIGESRMTFTPDSLQVREKDSFIKRALDTVNDIPVRQSLISAYLMEQTVNILGSIKVCSDLGQTFGSMGMDSLMAVELSHKVEKDLGIVISMADLLDGMTISKLSERLAFQYGTKQECENNEKVTSIDWNLKYPLSHGQRALWFLYKLSPDSVAYNISCAVRIISDINIPSLQKAFENVVEENPILRATFIEIDGEPVQKLNRNFKIQINVMDVSGWDENKIKAFLDNEANRPFKLEEEQLLRIHLLKDSSNRCILLLIVHHIIADFWSLSKLIQRLWELYSLVSLGKEVNLNTSGFSYLNYIKWQKNLLNNSEGLQMLNFWKNHIGDEVPYLNLPLDYPRPAVQTFNGDSVHINIDHDIVKAIVNYSKDKNTTLYTTLLAAFYTLIYRYSGDNDIIIGTPAAARSRADFSEIVGYFTNMLPLHIKIDPNTPFEEFLGNVRKTVLEAFLYQDYPFSSIVEKLQPDRDISYSPIFQVAFVFQQTTLQENKELASLALCNQGSKINLDGLIMESVEISQRGVPFDIMMMVAETSDGLGISIQFNKDLFCRETIVSMASHYKLLLENILSNSMCYISELNMLTKYEKEMLFKLNDTVMEYSSYRCIHELFEEQVKKTPEQIALIFGSEKLTYYDLDRRANILASYLSKLGAGPDIPVSIYLERSFEMIVCILGVLKAGSAYVPLDTSYPKDRLAFMLKDVGSPILLTQQRLLEHIPENLDTTIVLVDEEWNRIKNEPEEHKLPKVGMQNLCYIIYTSGSTGLPKGVMIEHRSVINLIKSLTDRIDFSTGKTIISLTSISFDIFIVDTLLPLTTGMKVVIADEKQQKDPNALKNIIISNNVDMLQATPSRLNILIEDKNSCFYLSKLKEIMSGGEPFTYRLLNNLSKYDNLKLYNMYAPSETTVYSTVCELNKNGSISIGKPIYNTYTYVLGSNGELLPAGIPGELYIAGDGVARGYLNKPELTAEKFLPNPYKSNSIMYKTGDIVKWLVDGNIEYLGREDNQVKIRGYRIEIAEIESRLLKHNQIKAAIVLDKIDKNGGKYLCAFIVSSQGLSKSGLRQYLGEWLPDYMIPSFFIEVNEIPITANGKVDKKALLLLNEDVISLDKYIAPSNEIEDKLEVMWDNLLDVNKVGTSTNFFLCGGDSLKAAALMYRIQREFKIDISLSDIFKYPTIKEMAHYIQDLKPLKDASIHPTPLKRKNNRICSPMSATQKRIFVLNSMDDIGITYNMPGCLLIEGDNVNVNRIEDIFKRLITRHEVLRTSFELLNEEPVQKVHEQVDFRVKYMVATESEIQKIVEEFIVPFNLTIAPLLRGMLVKLSENKHMLLFDMHHIISDGASISILIKEFADIYEGKELKPLKLQYRDFSQWQEEIAETSYMKKQEEYWLKTFEDDIPLLDIPVDYPRPFVQNFEGDYITFETGSELFKSLLELSAYSGATLNIVLLAAYNILLSNLSGQDDIIVGTLTAGRADKDLENTMGMFVNTIPLRNKIDQNRIFRNILDDVKYNFLRAYENQEYPFEQLLNKLNIHRDVGRSPLFDFMFIFQNKGIPNMKIGGITLTPREIERKVAKFDLTLEAVINQDSLQFKMEFRACLFKKDTIRRFSEYLIMILKQVVINPEIMVSDIEMIPEIEKNKLMFTFNNTKVDYPRDKTIQELFDIQVKTVPDNIAVIFEDVQLTYKQLNEKAIEIARMLKYFGISKGDIVGLAIPRTQEMIICILGILKANAVCLPIDLQYPEERIATILNDSGAKAILKKGNYTISKSYNGKEINICDVETDLYEATKLDLVTDSKSPAYIIFTSGSTGKPKGVELSHSGIINHTFTKIRELLINQDDILSHNLSINFVASIWQIFAPLFTGASIILYSEDVINNAYELFKRVDKDYVSILEIVPSLLSAYLELIDEGMNILDLHRLKTIVLTGEKVTPELVNKFYNRYKIELVNAYGQSECSDDTLHYHIPYSTTTVNVPIGKPSNNTYVYVLGCNQQLQPIGVAGELCISGDGLALGYLNSSEMTKEKFVQNPFLSGKLMYKTGDIVRWLMDGNIEYIGRRDRQIKIRGLRIELGEIESCILSYEPVKRAVVTVKGNDRDSYLCAFYVATQEIILSELKKHLHKQLPDYMIPVYYRRLDEIPVNLNGKIDYKTLLKLSVDIDTDKEYIAPVSEIEKILTNIWEGILKISRVGRDDRFFELGGHSLTALQMLYKINSLFKVNLSLKHFFEIQTISLMSDYIEKHSGNCECIEEIPYTIKADFNNLYEAFPLTDVQEAYWVGRNEGYELGNIGAHGYSEIDLTELDIERFEKALQKLIARHHMLRAVILPEGCQKILEHVPSYRIKTYDLRGQSDEYSASCIEEIRNQMSHQVFSSDRWPLFDIRVTLFNSRKVRLHFSLDLLIGDAWSYKILGRELSLLYKNLEISLPPLEISFRDYVLAEATISKTETYSKSLEFWKERIKNLPPAPELPLILNPSSLSKPKFVRRAAKLDKHTWTVLKEKISRKGLTQSIVLAAAFAEVLTVWSKSASFTINLTLFNRLPMHYQVNDIVGDFTSLTLLAVENIEQCSFESCALKFQEQLMNNLDHRYVSGVKIMRELAKMQGKNSKAIMPVVFTSILHQTEHKQESHSETMDINIFGSNNQENDTYSISQTPQVWLDHQVAESNGVLEFNWDAVEELFPEGMLDDMFHAYCTLLNELAENDNAWGMETYELVKLPEHQLKLLDATNNTQTGIEEKLLHELFIEMAKKQPHATAVVTSDTELTYREIYSFSNKIGHWIIDNGGVTNQLVAVVLEKGWEQVVAVLGILQAGTAYLPIDTGLPSERINYLLTNGNVRLVITKSRLEASIEWPIGLKCLSIDRPDILENIVDSPLELVQKTEDLAYVIYTSGSTGNPKGVMINHRGAVNTIMDVNKCFNITPEDRVLALSSLSFDLSVYDIFGILSAGGAIVIPDADMTRDPSHWLQLIHEKRVTIWNTVPALMEMLVEYSIGHADSLPGSLRLVMLSGDRIPVDLPDIIRTLSENILVISLGGATEASIWSIIYPIEGETKGWRSIPYGKPMANQRFYVLNEAFELCPVWVPGQLYIGGIGLAKGYWQDEAKTNFSFINYPRTGERLYRTGDLGRYLPDGNIEFLGREDLQVKIQGYRIELGEIEAVLNQHPLVRNGVVVVTGEKQNNKQLTAYFVLESQNGRSSFEGQDVVTDYSSSVEIITDPVERFKFKLTHPGIKKVKKGIRSFNLPQPETDQSLIDKYVTRCSRRRFEQREVPLEKLGMFMSCLMQIKMEGLPLPRYRYSSAGSLYPVQVYIYIKQGRVEGMEEGIYYYNPEIHNLILINEKCRIDSSCYSSGNREIYESSAFVLFLIGELEAISPMYGEWSRDFCLLEAGLITQTMEMTARDNEIGLCQSGGFDFDQIRSLFYLNESQKYLHSIIGGLVDKSRTDIDVLLDEYSAMESMFESFKSELEKNSDSINKIKRHQDYSVGSAMHQQDIYRKIISELQGFMREKLPHYMVPSIFVPIEQIPLSPNGKVDRKALPKPEATRSKESESIVKPHSSTEQIIYDIWKEVLNLDQFGVHDNFFDLGGTSIHLVRIHNKILEVLKEELNIVKLFEYSTVYSLSKYIESKKDNINSSGQSERRQASRISRQQRFEKRHRKGGVIDE